ncbi:hypothetical protein KFV02_05635 [Desulfohalobiaceae bacterium Ax17]|uniref:hypothetical protein n=1 Tax=Desulfovulcanus ferrireducens TaxID=2831190 RepID=UPI00207BBE71|nr:hypothetical protein [Desulfovulcanus ferrireducens]MBT8763409.1 hypothetical protein [Desulfovulcanus ferrireducens]
MFRFALNFGFVDRPLVAALFWSYITGEWSVSLNLAIFFELFWLDLFPAGTFIPPQSLFSTFASITLIHILNLNLIEEIFFAMILTIPLALFGSWLEGRQREWQNKSYNQLLKRCRRGYQNENKFCPGKLISGSILQILTINIVFAYLSIHFLIFIYEKIAPILPRNSFLAWPYLWIFASIGGILSLRIRRAYAVFFTGVLTAGAYLIFKSL